MIMLKQIQREYYLGNDFAYYDEHYIWMYSCKSYEKEAIQRAEEILGILPKNKTPLPYSQFHP